MLNIDEIVEEAATDILVQQGSHEQAVVTIRAAIIKVIEGLKEPSDSMCINGHAAGELAYGRYLPPIVPFIWEAMIDQALQELGERG